MAFDFLNNLFKVFLSVDKKALTTVSSANKILIIRQHNQFGDMLASVSLFRALKSKYENCEITVVASRYNYFALEKNPLIDNLFIYDQRKLFSIPYLLEILKLLNKKFELCIIPSTVSVSLTSLLLGRLSSSEMRIGPCSLNGITNKYSYLLNYCVDLDWRIHPDSHVSDFILDIIRPLDINCNNFQSTIYYNDEEVKKADIFFRDSILNQKKIGLHIGAGKPKNRWEVSKFIELAKYLLEQNCFVYITGTDSDKEILEKFRNSGLLVSYCLNNSINELAAIIDRSDLFITNDTGTMHVAGAVNTPQISIFGPTNPFNWAPIGEKKIFIRKSEFISEVEISDVIEAIKTLKVL